MINSKVASDEWNDFVSMLENSRRKRKIGVGPNIDDDKVSNQREVIN